MTSILCAPAATASDLMFRNACPIVTIEKRHRGDGLSGFQGAVSLASLYMVILILATQRRENQLAQLREQLNLELAILSEQKTAKVIQLLEESRRDNPLIRDRIDGEAEALAQPADRQSVLEAIKEMHAEAEQISGGAYGS